MKKLYCFIFGKYRKFKNPKISNIFEKHKFLLLFAVRVRIKVKKYLKNTNQLDIKSSWFNWKYVITKKTQVQNLEFNLFP